MSFGVDLREPEPSFLAGDSEMARLIAVHDWGATALGPLDAWPAHLKTVTSLILRCHVPIVTLWGEDGLMIYNDAYSVVAGGRHPQLLGSKVREGWEEVADFNDNVMRVGLAGGNLSFQDQELTLNRSGAPEQVWMDLDYSPILDEAGRPVGVIAIVIETTQKVLARRVLGESEAQLRRAQEAGGVGLFTIDIRQNQLRGTPEFYRLFGLPQVEVAPPEDIQRLVAPEDRQTISDADRRASGQAALDVEYRIHRADDGRERIIARRGEYERDADGLPVRLVGVVQDVTERRAEQRALEQSEAQFRALTQALPNQVWTATPSGGLDWFNARVLDDTGSTTEQLLGSGWSQLVHPEDLMATAERWSRAVASGETYEAEFRIRDREGRYRWHLSRAVPLRDADEAVIRWVGTNTDIHDQKLAEAQSTRDRDRMWTMSQDLMLVCDFEGMVTAANPSVTRLLGWDLDAFIGQPLTDFIHPSDLETTTAELEKLSTGRTTLAFENRYRTKSGGYRLLEWTAVPEAGRIHAVGRDITKERAAARDQERIWTLSPVLKLVAGQDGVIAAINPAWTHVLGWSAEETLGRTLGHFLSAEDRDAGQAILERLARGERVRDEQITLDAQDGERRHIVWTFAGEGNTVYGFGRDVTEQRAVEEALRQSQKMEAVGQLTGGIAHDFNNLLQGITGSLDLVQKRIAQGRMAELDRFVTGAMNSANRASALTHRLLAFSRRQPLDPRPVRANPLVASMEDLLRRTLGERVHLELVLAGGLWTTLCDPNQLESALLNLAINARDAMPDGGKLTIETCNAHLDSQYAARQREVAPGQYVCICVTDTGVGMDEATIARAFEPFFTTKPIGQGTGLGLSMIYGFARQSEGYAKIYSEVGNGTTFKLYLPRFRGPTEEDHALPELSQDHQANAGETVLVVEDEPVVRGLIVEVLSDLGYAAIEAADGNQGLEVLQSKRRIDLMITDMGLPGLNGRQIADAGRQLRPELRVLFMTGYAENAALASGFLEPGMAMITKPFAMELLATRVREILGEA